MLYSLLFPLADQFGAFNVIRYITFRTGGAVMTALLVSFLIGPALIRWLKRKQREGQPIRLDGPESHLLTKKGTPTMGGVLILLALTTATLLWADLSNGYVWVVADRHAGLRADRLRRRLPQADQALERRPVRPAQAAGPGRHRPGRRHRADPARHRRLRRPASPCRCSRT